MAQLDSGDGSGNKANVDAGKNLAVTLPSDEDYAGVARILDSSGRHIYTTEDGAVLVSERTPIIYDQVDGNALNTNIWTASTSGMTVVQGSGFITLNNGAATTASSYAIIQTIKSMPLVGSLPLRVIFNVKTPIQPEANATMEVGIGSVSGTSAPTDFCGLRWTPTGQFIGVMNNAGTETLTGVLNLPGINDGDPDIHAPGNSDMVLLEIVVVENSVQFWVDDRNIGSLEVPGGQPYPTNSGRLPVFARVYTSGSSPSTAPQLMIGQVVVVQEDMKQNKPWGETLATMGRGAYQSPITPFGQNANHANSTNPSSATLSNTAAGYTTLGGRFQFAAVAGAVTDFALFGFQIPAGYQFFCTGISISCASIGAIGSALTPTIFDWGIGINASAVSLATSENPPTTWSPKRIPLGMQTFSLSAVIGAQAPAIVQQFQPSIVTDGGRFLHVIVQVPVGAATASQIFRGDVFISGYFE